MAERARRVHPAPEEVLKVDPWLYYEVKCRWVEPILGTRPATDTMVSHLARIADDLVEKMAREAKRERPSQITAREGADAQNGD